MSHASSGASDARARAAGAMRARIERREITVAVIGLGYVGLPLLAAVAQAGFAAIGVDSDPTKIEKLSRRENYLPHLGQPVIDAVAGNPRVRLSADRAVLADADAILICVPTPLTTDRQPDLEPVERAARDIGLYAVRADPGRARLIVLESTTWPGTTREVVAPIVLASAGVEAAAVYFAFSPEREDPANRTHTTRTIPKLVGGIDEHSGALAQALYAQIVERVVPCRSAEVAEAAKLVENVYRSVNIALVNELKVVFDALGLDVWEVLDAAATKPFGFQRFNPGPGFGGHCVPIDPYYLTWVAQRASTQTRFVELAGEINRAMPAYVVDRCAAALAAQGRSLAGSRVLVLGLAYKPNVADVRESPSFELIEILRERGAEVSYHDPHVPRPWPGRRHDLRQESIAWTPQALQGADLVLIATDHDWYDWDFIGAHSRLIVDTRNAMARAKGPVPARIVKA